MTKMHDTLQWNIVMTFFMTSYGRHDVLHDTCGCHEALQDTLFGCPGGLHDGQWAVMMQFMTPTGCHEALHDAHWVS